MWDVNNIWASLSNVLVVPQFLQVYPVNMLLNCLLEMSFIENMHFFNYSLKGLNEGLSSKVTSIGTDNFFSSYYSCKILIYNCFHGNVRSWSCLLHSMFLHLQVLNI